MLEPPWFPEYEIQVSDSGPGAFVKNATDVRLTFRVPNPVEQLPQYLKEIIDGRP